MRCGEELCNAMLNGPVWCSALRCSALGFGVVRCGTVQCSAETQGGKRYSYTIPAVNIAPGEEKEGYLCAFPSISCSRRVARCPRPVVGFCYYPSNQLGPGCWLGRPEAAVYPNRAGSKNPTVKIPGDKGRCIRNILEQIRCWVGGSRVR